MPYAKSLRIIGQLFENAKLRRFELKTDGSEYVVQIDSLDEASEWTLRQAVSPVARESLLDGRCGSAQMIFHALMTSQRNKGKLIRLPRRPIVGFHNFYVPWAIILIEWKSAHFTLLGAVQFCRFSVAEWTD